MLGLPENPLSASELALSPRARCQAKPVEDDRVAPLQDLGIRQPDQQATRQFTTQTCFKSCINTFNSVFQLHRALNHQLSAEMQFRLMLEQSWVRSQAILATGSSYRGRMKWINVLNSYARPHLEFELPWTRSDIEMLERV